MNAYVYRADIYCSTCAGEIQKDLDKRGAGGRSIVVASYPVCWAGDSELYPNGPHVHGGGEADCPQHCGKCGVFLENPLTDDGVRYVFDAINANDGVPEVLAKWREFYKHELEDLVESMRFEPTRPVYYPCGICGFLHSARWNGDCRENGARFTDEELDTKHPEGWDEIPMEDVDRFQLLEGIEKGPQDFAGKTY